MRIIAGAMLEGPGWLILALRFAGVLAGDWPWFVGGLLVVLGTFLVIEGVLGWCIVRAMGVNSSE